MKNLTSVQAMYINRKRELQTITSRIDSIFDSGLNDEKKELYDELATKFNELSAQLELLELILEDDVPKVKGSMK